jgi:hypothetical protein
VSATGFQDPQKAATDYSIGGEEGGRKAERRRGRKERREKILKIYTKSFWRENLFEHLHPPIHTMFSSKNSQLAPSLPENRYLRNEKF